MGWDTSLYPRLLQAISSLALSISRFSGQYPPRTTTFTAKNFFLISYPNLCFVRVKLFPLILSLQVHVQSPPPALLYLSICVSVYLSFPLSVSFYNQIFLYSSSQDSKINENGHEWQGCQFSRVVCSSILQNNSWQRWFFEYFFHL